MRLVVTPEQTTTMTAVADVWCSDVELGMGVARLSWSPEGGGEDAKLAGPAPETRVEVTFYPLGFERNAFSVHEPGARTAQSMQASRSTCGAASLSKMLVDAPPMAAADAQYVLLSDLQPGVSYTWRLAVRGDQGWAPSAQTMTFQAPICPVDAEMGSEPAAQHTRGGEVR
jgi:hypothetical protein